MSRRVVISLAAMWFSIRREIICIWRLWPWWPEHSGKGLGRGLIGFVEHVARRDGFQAVELYTNEAMTENLAMYPKLGYRETHRKQDAGYNRVFFRKTV
jgi:Acetyltransferase (GNAT) family